MKGNFVVVSYVELPLEYYLLKLEERKISFPLFDITSSEFKSHTYGPESKEKMSSDYVNSLDNGP